MYLFAEKLWQMRKMSFHRDFKPMFPPHAQRQILYIAECQMWPKKLLSNPYWYILNNKKIKEKYFQCWHGTKLKLYEGSVLDVCFIFSHIPIMFMHVNKYVYTMDFIYIHPHNLTDGRELAVIFKSRQKAVGSVMHDGLWRQNITCLHWWLYSCIHLSATGGWKMEI